MNKICINLNPRKEKVESIILQRIVSYTPFVALGAIVVFAAILILSLFIFFKINTYNAYKQQWAQNGDKYAQISKIKKEAKRLTEEVKVLRQMTTPDTHIVKILEDVFNVLPQNVWFKDLTFRQGALNLEGYVVAWQEDYLISLVDKFIKPLKRREYFPSKFKKVNLKHSQRTAFYGIEVLEYSIECKN
ncbi:MAG: hypothetical protein JSV34_01825 [Candidatus Omnitrophota bacterium]|nr:MAG: hypothetical protein JSV34_01825 [Candidatus Omnitrophota bacterium]